MSEVPLYLGYPFSGGPVRPNAVGAEAEGECSPELDLGYFGV